MSFDVNTKNKNKLRPARNYRSHWHCIYHLKYHLVLVTKYHRKCLSPLIQQRLKEIVEETCLLWDVTCEQFGAEADHIHLLLDFHPSLEPAKFIGNLKTVTSRLLRKEFQGHFSKYYWKPVLWSRAYCLISAGGAPLRILSEYIAKHNATESLEVRGDDNRRTPTKATD
jgi:putative transposase